MPKRAFAIAAHPDDIEFMMSGTLILLGRAEYELHTMTVANGSCGTDRLDVEAIARIRRQESIDAAGLIGAVYHESLVDDIEIYYERETLRRLGAVVREVAPEIILTQSTEEYMEDHSNTTRLVLSAAFTRGMRNFWTTDELWHSMVNLTGAEMQPLCEVFSEPDFHGTGKFEPAVVPSTFGQGRGLNIVLGHDVRAMKNAGWRTLMLRGLEWAATGDVTIPIPEDWPHTAAAAAVTAQDLDAAIRGLARHSDYLLSISWNSARRSSSTGSSASTHPRGQAS